MGIAKNISFKNLFLYFAGQEDHSNTRIFEELFDNKKYERIVIPEYQRGYVWDEKQIDDFIDSFFNEDKVFFWFFCYI